MCLASHNNHPTSLASSWDISFLKSLVQQDPKGSNKVAHHFILYVFVSPNRKYVNLSVIYYIADFSFFMSQDDAYFHIHQNDPAVFQSHQPKQKKCRRLWGGHGRGHERADQEVTDWTTAQIIEKFLMRALHLIESDHRNLKKVTDTGVGTGDKEESLVRIPYFST